MKKVTVLVATHKLAKIPQDNYYLPIHAGRINAEYLGYKGDNTGDNISFKNPYYSELTVLYWAWKNLKSDYIGLVHYRRFFTKRSAISRISKDKFQYVLKDKEIKNLIEDYDIILPKKRKYYIETLYSHYKHTMYIEPLDMSRDIIKEQNPNLLSTFDKVMNQSSGHMFNMFIMRQDLFDQYCQWLFPILEELEEKVDISQYDSFHARFLGRISELLFNVWLDNQKENKTLKIAELPIVSDGKTNWPKKIGSFLGAKYGNKKYGKSF
ncbi:hypothetical protein LMG8526HA_00494 [Lactococcus lactis]|uniref:DUF4422 domain-containing protein n=1 Tax=Lactococcus lactis TaxID=1358 RepID=UPI00071C9E3C|nr:DUF4422 domain-containing protein [Lactococcus lactis]KSU11655.1 Glycosyltransferase [Lactococcus lactis subsp. lactis]MDU0399637.1 hypothetical protein [Lactococcus lactis]